MVLRGTRPTTMRTSKAYFLAKVKKTDTCWIWYGALRNGYGCIRINRVTVYAHRFAYECYIGPIPENCELDHTCNFRRCVNPNHLEPVTHLENIRRYWKRDLPREEVTCNH